MSRSDWTTVPLAQATAATNSVEWRLDPSGTHGLAVIPADWLVRLSYDDLRSESIPSADLRSEAGVLLQLDTVLIRQLQDAILRGDLQSATLTLGPADRADQIYSFDLDDYPSSDALVTAIGRPTGLEALLILISACWLCKTERPVRALRIFRWSFSCCTTAPLRPSAHNGSSDEGGGRNLGILDADGRSLWNDWSGGALEIDRFGDQRDRLGFSVESIHLSGATSIPGWYSDGFEPALA